MAWRTGAWHQGVPGTADPRFGLNRAVAAIDDLLPTYDARELHSIAFALEPGRAIALALATPVAPGFAVRTLFRMRGLGTERDDRPGASAPRSAGDLAHRGGDRLRCRRHAVASSRGHAPVRRAGRYRRPSRGRLPRRRHPTLHRDAHLGARRAFASRLSPLLARRRPVLGARAAALARGDRTAPRVEAAPRPGRRHRRVGRDVRPGEGRGGDLSAVRVPRAALRDRERARSRCRPAARLRTLGRGGVPAAGVRRRAARAPATRCRRQGSNARRSRRRASSPASTSS